MFRGNNLHKREQVVNFFEHQEQAKRKTVLMVMLFCLATFITVSMIHYVLSKLLVGVFSYPPGIVWGFDILAVVVALCMVLHKLHQLKEPASAFAKHMGAYEVQDDGAFYHKRLKNIVEEMAIASSTPCPRIFIIPFDMSINAFAAGYNPSQASIFVTEGTLKNLNRQELQGVIAHEFSHILNGDMRSNVIMVAVLEGLEGVFNFAWESITHDHHDDHLGKTFARGFFSNRASSLALVAFIVMAIGSVGMFFSRLIKASISREREYLADASAVQFTRQTEGIEGALKKIALLENEGLVGSSSVAPEVSHMMFSRIFKSGWFSADTHPPLRKRLQRLNPSYNNDELARFDRKLSRIPNPEGTRFNGFREDLALGFASQNDHPNFRDVEQSSLQDLGPIPYFTQNSQAGGLFGTQLENIALKVGAPTDGNIELASYMRTMIPEKLSKTLPPEQTVCLLYALMLDQNSTIYHRQLSLLKGSLTSADSQTLELYSYQIKDLPHFVKTSLLWLHLPSLRTLTPTQISTFAKVIEQINAEDNDITLFENALRLSVQSFLRDLINPHRRKLGNWNINDASPHIEKLLWFMAQQNGPNKIYAFHAGWKAVFGRSRLDTPQYHVVPSSLDGILTKLTTLNAHAKEQLIRGLEVVIAHDHQLTASEVAFLRACCFTLNCPLPPLHIDVRS